jgi:hypothetical protein
MFFVGGDNVMSHTRRIYNRIIKKCHRIKLNLIPSRSIKDMVESGEINNPLRNAVHDYGVVYHPYAWLCMGKCPGCRDRSKDQHHLRKIRKVEFRRLVRREVYNAEEC